MFPAISHTTPTFTLFNRIYSNVSTKNMMITSHSNTTFLPLVFFKICLSTHTHTYIRFAKVCEVILGINFVLFLPSSSPLFPHRVSHKIHAHNVNVVVIANCNLRRRDELILFCGWKWNNREREREIKKKERKRMRECAIVRGNEKEKRYKCML